MSVVDMTYDEFIKTVPNDNNYKDRQFIALQLKRGMLGVETQDFKDVGTYKSMEPVPEGAKVCFSRGSVTIPKELVSPDSNVKIFRSTELEPEPIVINPPTPLTRRAKVIGRVPPNRQGGRHKKKRSTRKRKH